MQYSLLPYRVASYRRILLHPKAHLSSIAQVPQALAALLQHIALLHHQVPCNFAADRLVPQLPGASPGEDAGVAAAEPQHLFQRVRAHQVPDFLPPSRRLSASTGPTPLTMQLREG